MADETAQPPTGIAAVLGRTALVMIGLSVVGIVLTGALRFAGASDVIVFVVAAATLAGLAGLVGEGTDNLGGHFGPGATGVLQSALGNLPELFISIFALRDGLVVLTQTALIGSILGNSLLVLGLAFLLGGLKNGRQVFDAAPVRTIAIILVLAVGALAIPTISTAPGGPDSGHDVEISVFVSIVLLIVFVASIPYSLKGGQGASAIATRVEDAWPLKLAIGVLAAAGLGAAVVADWFVAALQPAMATLGWSEAFVGLVVVALAGNAVENVVGVQQAMRNRTDLSISLIQNSSLQVALALTPVLVLVEPVHLAGADDARAVADPARGHVARRGPRRVRGVRRRVDLARGADAARALRDHRRVGLVRTGDHGLAAGLAGRRRSSGLDQPGLVGEHDRRDPVTQPELREHAREVRLHGRLAHDEGIGDLRVRQPAGGEHEDLALPLRQPRRGERASSGAGVPRCANVAITRPVTAGASSALPAATVRTAATSSSAGACLSRKPLAPARRASNRYSSRSNVVTMTTRASGVAATIRRVASSPSIPGIWTSISTTSGVRQRTSSTAAAPSAASPTTSMSGSASRISRSPERTIAWSSARTTRITRSLPSSPALTGSRASTRKPPSSVGPASTRPAEHRRPLAHADEARARIRGRRRGRRRHAPGR